MEQTGTMDRDPFANTADTAAYVPRTATEYALVELEMALRDGARAVHLIGPTGSGKSLLLRVLEERLADDFVSLRVPYSKLDPDEFCGWGLDALGERPTERPEPALAARITRGAARGDPPLVWVVDDADLLPLPTLQTLLAIQCTTGEALRLLFASSSELPAHAFTRAGIRPVRVELEGEMNIGETASYVRARRDRVGADPAECVQIEAALDRLFARSHGNPGRLHGAAAALLCFGPDRIGAPAEEPERAARAESGAEIPVAEIAVTSPARAAQREIAIAAGPAERGVSIESLVAEVVASEPLEEVALRPPSGAVPTTALVAPATSEPDALPSAPAPRKRLRLRRFGRR